ncbi:MAG: BlaI/MecI/CopY family transcriptional regulator [Lachnospiraceae bacterium]|jgi:BlaI family penicillinase repressor|nr:BlaI/MecI/CopY family transcriptional regulator [Lachnospiraceae bacterium]
MKEMRMGIIESKFADLIWQHEPITTSELIKLCESQFDWKRTTTYTVLKRLSERGIFQNKDKIVTSLISREEFYSLQSEKFVEETFSGSLPAFLAAFTARKKLNAKEVEEIRRLIEPYDK